MHMGKGIFLGKPAANTANTVAATGSAITYALPGSA